jgi:F-type H+-transporting ATPase subunit gamma
MTSDRGLCGAFNSNVNRAAEREWRERSGNGQNVQFVFLGRKGRDYFRRRGGPTLHVFEKVWDKLDESRAKLVAEMLVPKFVNEEVDAVYLAQPNA